MTTPSRTVRWGRGREGVAVAVALQLDDVGVIQQAVHGRAGEEGVAEEGVPLLNGPVAGDDGRPALVATSDDLVEVVGLVVAEGAESEVVEDEEVGTGEAEEASVVALVGPGGAEFVEHLVGLDIQGGVSGPAGAVAEGLGQAALADAGWTNEVDDLGALHEAQAARSTGQAPVSSPSSTY